MKKQSWHCLAYGMGYTATFWARRLMAEGIAASGLTRDPTKAAWLIEQGFDMALMGDARPLELATHLLVSVPPGEGQARALADLARMPHVQWIGYLSSTGVYGDCGGEWVDEDTPPRPHDRRTQVRLDAEREWQDAAARRGVPLAIFRLAGIYGPGRNALATVAAGTARRIIYPGLVFSRIHVEDIAQTLVAAMGHAGIYNLCDDLPAEASAVIDYACSLLGVAPPPAEDFATAELSAMMRSFYAANRRVKNNRIKTRLGIKLAYPTYREGLQALHAGGEY